MKKYKLTNQNMQTHNGCQWQLGEEKETSGFGETLCNGSWLHYYDHPLLAILLNPIHANPRLFEIKAEGKHLTDNGLKGGCSKMTLIKELKLPEVTLNQRVIFGLLCASTVYKEESFLLWAANYANGKDRTAWAARDAAWAARDAARDAAGAAARAAAWAAARDAAGAAARAAAGAAAWAAAGAAAWAAAKPINLIKIAKMAMKYK
jgi:hypothetical protein